jgi:hypothetical protein
MTAMVACPIHDQRVAVDQNGKLLGRCQDCIEEAAEAIALVGSGVASARAWAARTLTGRSL